MSNDNQIKNFTAADIERYHKGLLSPKERNALEKAALDDPFLADALEGYGTTGVNLRDDIDDLRSRLAKRASERKVIPLLPRNNRFYNLRIAAILILLAGAGWLVYQYTSQGKKQDIAQLPALENKGNAGTDTTFQNEPGANATTTNRNVFTDTNAAREGKDITKRVKPVPVSTEKNKWQNDSIARVPDGNKEIVATIDKPPKTEEMKHLVKDKTDGEVVVSGMGATRKGKETNTYAPASRGAIEENNLRSNNFKAQVRGNNNEPVPFANITVLNNNTSTYTDANGKFGVNLNDTVATVEVRSIGYENNRAVLRNNVSTDIILNPSRSQLSEVVVTATKKADDENESKKADASPVDGWEKYNAYLQNNILVPADLKRSKKGNFVELVFDINKNGQPSNISVETSLGRSSNREAIRLLKEGPKWNGNIGRIRIYFK